MCCSTLFVVASTMLHLFAFDGGGGGGGVVCLYRIICFGPRQMHLLTLLMCTWWLCFI